GIGLLMVFGITLGWLPVDNTAIAFGTTFEQAKTYVLPVLTLAIVATTYIVRIGRAAMREALSAPFTQAAILRGLPRRWVLWDHAMRTAATPILNAVGLTLIYLLGGVIIVESLFGIPGLGSRLVEGILQGDAPTVQAIALLLGSMFIFVNFVVDLLVLVSNPRLRGS
ncbi:MAG TPA: ABC transporter permease, partial [Baekduia sp.]|nr:ABC transporter permease [Baekduia sp.]